MRNCWKLGVTSLLAVAFAGVVGCGSSSTDGDSSGDQTPATAAIGDPGGSSAGGAAAQGGESAQDTLHPIVALDTSLGKITVQLDAEKAPLTVDNFLYYVEHGFYDQTVFHQAVEDQVVLGGGYTADLVEKNTRTSIRNEAYKSPKNTRGTIAMVRRSDSIDSATSQFFFNLDDHPHLDHQAQSPEEAEKPEKYGYCVFGRVIEGMDVVEKIGRVQVEDAPDFPRKPVKTVLINSARRIR